MGKRTAKVPLALISPNESVYGTRSKRECASISEGKENTPVRSVRRGTRNAADEQPLEMSRSSNERHQVFASQKRDRQSALTSPTLRSGLRRGNKGSRGEDIFAGSQSSSPVRVGKGEDFLRDEKVVKKLQITAIADACSPSDDGIESAAPDCTAVVHISDSSDEHRPSASRSLDQNAVSAEVAAVTGSKAPVAHALRSSPEEPGRNPSAGKRTSSMKTYRRKKASRCPNAPTPQEVLGTQRNTVELPSRDDNSVIDLTEFCRSDEQRAAIARATDALQSAYDKLYKKYQSLKMRQIADAEGAFDEQSKRIEVFSRAADDLVETLRTTHSEWEHQEEIISRSRLMEAAYIECQNDLAMERARSLELRQRLENADLRGSKLLHDLELRQHLENTDLRGSKLLHDLLENTTQLTIVNYGKSEIIFSHNQSGYEFKLEQNKRSEEIGGKDALLYNVVSSGTILHVAPDWMRSEIVFEMAQLQVFFRRILAVALCGGVSV